MKLSSEGKEREVKETGEREEREREREMVVFPSSPTTSHHNRPALTVTISF
jgi:hypothetical protein